MTFMAIGDRAAYAFGAIIVERQQANWRAYLARRRHLRGWGGSAKAAIGDLLTTYPDEVADEVARTRREREVVPV